MEQTPIDPTWIWGFRLVFLFMGVTLWRVFRKAGQPGWAAFIPLYNFVVIQKIARKPTWHLLFWIIPILNLFFIFPTYFSIGKNFGKSAAFNLGMVVLSPIFLAILAFGKAEYQPEQSPQSPLPSASPRKAA